MSMLETDGAPTHGERAPVPISEIDLALTIQIVVAWAGESGEERRLGWWRSDLISEFGGEDLFRRLLPNTWRWAVLQCAREAARRKDAELRSKDHDPDRILSLYSLGFELDERIEERLRDLERSGAPPLDVLPGLELLYSGWDKSRFSDWLTSHGDVETAATPAGRRVKGSPPSTLQRQLHDLVAGLAPLADAYPLPHFRRSA